MQDVSTNRKYHCVGNVNCQRMNSADSEKSVKEINF